MSKIAVEHIFQGATAPISAYDSTKTLLGSLIQQRAGATGSDQSNFFAGPIPIGMARPAEVQATGPAGPYVPMMFPHVFQRDVRYDCVFLIENSTATSSLRKVYYYLYDRQTSVFTFQGLITLNFSRAAAYTCAAFRVLKDAYTTGTASCSGITVTGYNTTWRTDRLAGGARIGFGNSDPTQISQWYYLQPTGPATSNTSWQLTTTGPTGPTGPYVIEELRIASLLRGVTVNGGLFFTKGLNFDTFGPTGPIIGMATGPTGVDNLRGTYWLKDSAVNRLVNPIGCGLTDMASWQQHDLYVMDATGPGAGATLGWKVLGARWNLRASLSPGTSAAAATGPGADIGNALYSQTATGPVVGSCSTINSATYANAQHGPGNNIPSIYFVTNQAIYRSPISSLAATGATNFLEYHPEYPPGIGSTGPTGPTGAAYPVTSSLSTISYMPEIDRFIVTTNNKTYVTQYRSTGPTGPGWAVTGPGCMGKYPRTFDHIMGINTRQLDQSSAFSLSQPIPSISTTGPSSTGPASTGPSFYTDTTSGILYLCRNYVGPAGNQVYAVPLGADWAYAAGTGPTGPNGPTGPGSSPYPGSTGPTGAIAPYAPQRIITPSIATPNAVELIRVYPSCVCVFGPTCFNEPAPKDDRGLTTTTESFRIYARTSGITDNTGTWTLIGDNGSLTGLTTTNEIQFAIEFKIISPSMIPARISSLSVLYEDNTTDSHYRLSVSKSDIANKRFAWWFSKPFNEPLPDLRVRIYNATGPTGPVLIDDNTVSPIGTFERSMDGTSWLAWDKTDRGNSTTYLRYTNATGPADNINVIALLTRN